MMEKWIVDNHWDTDVTATAIQLISAINSHHALFLVAVIASCALHTFNSLLLVLGALLEKRLLLLPWLIQDSLAIAFVALLFVFGAFFSFFVHVLVAVLFPVAAGLILGFWIYMWRNVKEFFHLLGADAAQHTGTVYRKLPPPNASGVGVSSVGSRSLLGP